MSPEERTELVDTSIQLAITALHDARLALRDQDHAAAAEYCTIAHSHLAVAETIDKIGAPK